MTGRPTKYRKTLDEQAYKLCLLGLTDTELAERLGVHESTLNDWKLKHKSFRESLYLGKEGADSEVAASLLKRAKGYTHKDVHYPPETKAAILWLGNRQRNRWRERQTLEHTGPNGGPVVISSDDGNL